MNPILLLFIFLCPFLSIIKFVNGSTICSSNPCLNGVCVVDDSSTSSSNFSCFCLDGFTGKLCDRKFDECLQGRNPCQNNATCVNSTPTSRCICPEGYCGRYCEMEIDECHSSPCLNGGMCLDKLNGYQCLCPLGYSGLRCEVDIDACDPDVLRHLNLTRHCENGGTCKDGPGQEYFCVCPRGYTGGRCETMMDECGSGPCLNGARCEKLVGGFNCVCAYGWTGTVCDRPLRKCSPTNHCKNPSALCMEPEEDHSPLDYFCYCPPDYHGKHCELRYNECQPNNCLHNGTCVDGVDGYECHCVDNWSGKNCEVDCEEEVEMEVEGVGQVCGTITTSTPTTIQVTVTPTIETATTTTSPTSATITIEPSFSLPSPSTSPEVPLTSTTLPPTSTPPPISTATTSAPPTSTPAATPIPTSPTISTSISTPPTSVPPTSAPPISVPPTSTPPTSTPPTSTPLTSTPPTSVPPISTPPTSTPHTLDPTIRRIYAPSFTTPTSSLTFRVRRVKRQSSTLKFDLIPHKDPASGTILYANTSRYHLHLYLQDNRMVSKLWDGKQPNATNFLELRSSFPLESSQRYSVQLSLTAVKGTLNSISAELSLWNRSELLSSISGVSSNLTVPCFECYQLGGVQLESNPQSFDGCILNFEINGHEKFPKDAIAASNVSECSGQELVCSQMKPCRNGGDCKNGTDGLWQCNCPVGFRGWLCDEVYCDGNICGNGGLCLVSNNRHVCVCAAGFYGLRCEFKMNLTFPLFNISPNGSSSYIKYRLPYDMKEFFEIRFRFIAHDLDQKNGLLMFISELSGSGSSSSTNPLVTTTEMSPRTSVRDFISLVYEEKNLALRMNLGQGEKTLRAPTEQNTTEQMVLFGRFHQTFWLLVVPAHLGTNDNKNGSTGLQPQVGRMPLHHRYLNVDPYLYVGGHEDWRAHPALGNLVGFKGCIYDIDIRNSRAANFTRLEDKLIDNLANIEQCDFECT